MRGGKGNEPRGSGAAGAGSAEEGAGPGQTGSCGVPFKSEPHYKYNRRVIKGKTGVGGGRSLSLILCMSQYAVETEAKLDQLRSLVEAADRDKVELLNQLEEEKRWVLLQQL